MAHRDDWDTLRGQKEDDDEWDEAIDDLDRDFEHNQYYEAQRIANERNKEYMDDEPNEDDLDALHRHVDLQEAARAAAWDVANQRYTWHGRWDKGDDEEDDSDEDDSDEDDSDEDDSDSSDGHEHQADGWANRAHAIWGDRRFRDVEQEHDRVDRQHAWGKGMLLGYTNEEENSDEEENDAFDDDEEYTGGLFSD